MTLTLTACTGDEDKFASDFRGRPRPFEAALEGVDSLLSWGLLSSIFEGKEYIDPRVLEGLAAAKLKDPAIAAEWAKALQDPKLAADSNARYQWWFRHTPYWDERVGLLPYFRVMTAPKLATRPWR